MWTKTAELPACSKKARLLFQTFWIGNWDKLPDIYRKIIAYARERHIELSGCVYKEVFNEMSLSNMEDHITRIVVGVNA